LLLLIENTMIFNIHLLYYYYPSLIINKTLIKILIVVNIYNFFITDWAGCILIPISSILYYFYIGIMIICLLLKILIIFDIIFFTFIYLFFLFYFIYIININVLSFKVKYSRSNKLHFLNKKNKKIWYY